jgi:proteasome activator subunit 4
VHLNVGDRAAYVDKIKTGFLLWTPTVKGYKAVQGNAPAVSWELPSQPSLRAISELMLKDDYFQKLATLWSQESGKSGGNVDLRGDNVAFIKTLGSCGRHPPMMGY